MKRFIEGEDRTQIPRLASDRGGGFHTAWTQSGHSANRRLDSPNYRIATSRDSLFEDDALLELPPVLPLLGEPDGQERDQIQNRVAVLALKLVRGRYIPDGRG